MELEGEVQGRQDQAQKIIDIPQRDQETSTSEDQPSSASVVSMYGQGRSGQGSGHSSSISSLHQQLAGASGTQTIQLREELVLAVAQNASAQATVFEAEVKDKLEERRKATPGIGDPDQGIGFGYWDRTCKSCQDRWEVFKLAIRQFYGIEFNFTRTDEYFGICNDDETIWLMKENRKEERQ